MGKIVFLIIDGLGDEKIKQLNFKTPLEYANKPNIALLQKHAVLAYPNVLGKLAPESDSGVLSDLGYDPRKYSTGRGWFECLGLNLRPEEGDISLRVNLGQVIGRKLSSVRVYLDGDELKEIEGEINKKVNIGYDFDFKTGKGYRAGLVIRHKDKPFSPFISNNEPGYTTKFYGRNKLSFAEEIKSKNIKEIKALKPDAVDTAKLLNLFVHRAADVLERSSVSLRRKRENLPFPNYVFLRDGAVERPKLEDINKKYSRSWAAVVGMPLEKGIALSLGMHLMDTEEEEDIETDLMNKAENTIKALKRFDAVYIHIKQTDSFSHLGKFVEKYQTIEKIDKIFIGSLLDSGVFADEDTFVVTCDHVTSSISMHHLNSNIPVLISNSKFGPVDEFSESSCKFNHRKDIRRATDIMPFIMKL